MEHISTPDRGSCTAKISVVFGSPDDLGAIDFQTIIQSRFHELGQEKKRIDTAA
ncbi:MAG: hypothetical protein HOM34_09895 [Planctomycetes bacterium]|nr:hypothetical protein [Planctomycetota bacterium]